jgi:hypothetical protein
MRMNLITKAGDRHNSSDGKWHVSLTIRPSCGLPGDYQFPTDLAALMKLLRKETNLPEPVLERFECDVYASLGGRLLGVELSERLLSDIGYFVD